MPAVVGLVENVTLSELKVAAATVPIAPSLKVTVSLAAIGSKATPLIVIWVALAARLAAVLAGRGTGVVVPVRPLGGAGLSLTRLWVLPVRLGARAPLMALA